MCMKARFSCSQVSLSLHVGIEEYIHCIRCLYLPILGLANYVLIFGIILSISINSKNKLYTYSYGSAQQVDTFFTDNSIFTSIISVHCLFKYTSNEL